jgi:hypothetical protein
VASVSQPPPSGGNAKYAIIGVALLLLVGGLGWCLLKGSPPPPPPPHPAERHDAGAQQAGLGEEEIDLPDLGTDFGPQPDLGGPHKIIRYVYVGGNWDCSGDIPVASIRQVVQDNNAQVRNCYERRLKVKNTLQGSVTVSLRVGNNGAVTATNVGGSLNDNETFTCIRSLADHWHFPAPTGGGCAVVRVPFNLTPRN